MNDPAQPAAIEPEVKTPGDGPAEPRLPVPSTDPTHFVVKILSYTDNYGRQIDDREPAKGPAPEGFFRYMGVGDVTIVYPNGKRQTQVARFPLKEAKTLDEAYDLYDAAFDKARTEVQAQFDAKIKEFEEQQKKAQAEATNAQTKELRGKVLAATGQPYQKPGPGGRR